MKMAYLKDEFGNVDKNYMITKDGSYIMDKKTGDKLVPYIHQEYKRISITISRIRYSTIKICILQWWAWRGMVSKGHDIHHAGRDKKGKFDKLNDHVYCLQCLTHGEHKTLHSSGKDNPMYGMFGDKNPNFGKGLFGKDNPRFGKTGKLCPMFGNTGEKSSNHILYNEDVRRIFFLRYIEKLTELKIAIKLNVSRGCINHILLGDTWNPDKLTKDQLKNYFMERR